MKRNIFYDLPEDILYLIYKKYYTVHVMEQLKSRPGNFAWLDADSHVVHHLERVYRTINNIGPLAWNFLRSSDNYLFEANRFDNTIAHNGDLHFKSLIVMHFISKNGWDVYKNQFKN